MLPQLMLVALILAGNPLASSAGAQPTTKEAPPTSKKQASVLFVAPFGSKSMKNFYYGIIEAIVKDGYKVTLVTNYAPSRELANVREVVFEENDLVSIIGNPFKDSFLTVALTWIKRGPEMCFAALAAPDTQDALKDKYDLAFVSAFYSECFLPDIHAMKIPLVAVIPAAMGDLFTARWMGNPTFSSFTYNPVLNFHPPFSFTERLLSTVSDAVSDWILHINFKHMDSTGESLGFFPPGSPPTADIAKNASLMIVNSVRLQEQPQPYMPNILLAGGIHCKPAKPLPKELEKWVESSGEAGVIFFSVGTSLRSTDIPEEAMRVLVSAFASLPQKVLWKFDIETLPGGVPKNVRLTKWAPQQDLLGDPRIRLFITQGGLFSTQEALYHGVPVLGLPIFDDQEGNIDAIEAQGWGKKLAWDTLTVEGLRAAVEDLIGNSDKIAAVRKHSQHFNDAPLTPAQKVIWWTNYVMRTEGAPHLRSGAVDLSWYQLYNTDVWLVLLSAALLLLWLLANLLRMLMRLLWSCCCGGKKRSGVQQKKRKQQ